MVFDEDNLRDTATAVLKHNKYAKGDTVENIVEMVKSAAHREYHSWDGHGSYMSTYGYMITPFINPAGEKEIIASVAAHLFR